MKKIMLLVSIFTLLAMPNTLADSPKKSIIFVIDVSGSMKGDKLESTKDAVAQVTKSINVDTLLGVISFNQNVNLVQAPTLDHEMVIKKTSELQATGETSLFDAVEFSLNTDFSNGIDQIILLGDGEDTTSQLRLEKLVPNILQKKIVINTIGVQVTEDQGKVLQKISEASGGRFFKVDDISSLIETYQIILRDKVKPEVSEIPTSSIQSSSIGMIHIFFGLTSSLLTFLLLNNVRKVKRLRKQQAGRFRILLTYSTTGVLRTRNKLKTIFLSYSFVPSKIENKIKASLEEIHSNLKYESVINLLLTAWFLFMLLVYLIAKNFWISLFASLFLISFGFRILINSSVSRQRREFDANLPEMLNLLASALRSGLTLNQGLEAYAAESNNEVSRQIRRANSEIKLGTPIDEALLSVAKRMSNEDLEWAVTALSIQRIVGGSMATILSTAYETIRSRSEIRREVRTLSAEGRLSAYVLMALPVGIFLFLLLTRREYASLFFTNPLGIFLLIVAFFMLSVGWRWISAIVNIKI